MQKRKVNIWHLLLTIMVAAIGVFLIVCFAIDLFGDDKKNDSSAYATPTPVATTKPIETDEPDFYVEPSTTPSLSEKTDTKNEDLHQEKLNDEETVKKTNPDTSNIETTGMKLTKTYDNIRIRNGIAITAKAGSSSVKIVLTDESGNQKIAFNQNGPFNTSENCDVESGIYTISLYTSGNDWSWSYSLY